MLTITSQPNPPARVSSVYVFCRLLLSIGVVALLLSATAQAAAPSMTVEAGIQAVLDKTLDEREAADVRGLQNAALDLKTPGQEVVVLWVKLGPTYWSTQLSVLSQSQGRWTLLATTSLDGSEVEAFKVGADGLIGIEAKTLGPKDPICCPSQVTTLRYRYSAGQLLAVR